MEIEYDGLPLQVVQLLDFRRVPTYSEDSTTYLHTEVFIRVTCLLAPGATTFSNPAGEPGPAGPVPQQPQQPPQQREAA